MLNEEIKETRIRLGKEFDTVPDESIEMLILSLKLIARMMLKKTQNESE